MSGAHGNMGSVTITDQELSRVVMKIDSQNTLPIATGVLGLSGAEVGTATAAARDNQFQLKFEILKIWRNRQSTLKNVNQRQVRHGRFLSAPRRKPLKDFSPHNFIMN